MNICVPTAEESILVSQYDDPVLDLKNYITNSSEHRLCDGGDSADVIIILEEWETRNKNYYKVIAQCALVNKHLEKTYVINCDDLGRGFLPGCYTSLNPRNFNAKLHLAASYPYDINKFVLEGSNQVDRFTGAEYLFSFSGTPVSNPIRQRVLDFLHSHPRGDIRSKDIQFHHHSDLDKQQYVNEIRNSKFVLCPRGWSPATYRIFESMALSRCPVIISDDWIQIDNINWDECAIRVKESEVELIPQILKEKEEQWQQFGRNAHKVWKDYFSPESRSKIYLDAILKLHHTYPRQCSDVRDWWRSRQFHQGNGWLVSQRINRLVNRALSKFTYTNAAS